MKDISEQEYQVLKGIQDSVPQEWRDRLSVEEYTFPSLRELVDRAEVDPDLDDELRAKVQLIRDQGLYEQKSKVVVPEVSALIDAYMEKEIVKAMTAKKLKRGRRSPRWETVSKRYNLAKQQYDKRFETAGN